MSWITGGRPADFGQLIGLRPNLAADLAAFSTELWQGHGVDALTLELCRLRIAALHGSAADCARRTPQALAAGLDEDHVARLPDWHRDPAFGARARACIALAEQFVLDPSGVDDAMIGTVRAELGEAATVTLLEALAIFDGFTRFAVLLQAAPEGVAA